MSGVLHNYGLSGLDIVIPSFRVLKNLKLQVPDRPVSSLEKSHRIRLANNTQLDREVSHLRPQDSISVQYGIQCKCITICGFYRSKGVSPTECRRHAISADRHPSFLKLSSASISHLGSSTLTNLQHQSIPSNLWTTAGH